MDGTELDENDDDQVMTISEFVETMEAQELEANLVLGGDEGKECTYEKGYMKRQAVFSCLTCTPAGNAGVCTACSFNCHDGHEVVELWTRRGFRCDCGNERFGVVECKLYKDKESQNKGNAYNQNFRGLYCSCHGVFPDPDPVTAEESEMLQCCICEDWFHVGHLGFSALYNVPRDEEGDPLLEELICPSCAPRCSFLSHYQDLIVPPVEGDEEPALPSSDVEDPPPPTSSVVSKDDSDVPAPQPSSDGLTNGDASEASGSNRDSNRSSTDQPAKLKLHTSGEGNVVTAIGESSNGGMVTCKLKPLRRSGGSQLETNGVSTSEGVETKGGKQLKTGEAVFMSRSWRAELCRCDACLAMYAANEVDFLLDDEDTLHAYEETAKKKIQECEVKQDSVASDFVKTLGHVQKMELFHGVNDMATELTSFLTSFSEAGKTVTSADIYEFFEKLQQKRRRLR